MMKIKYLILTIFIICTNLLFSQVPDSPSADTIPFFDNRVHAYKGGIYSEEDIRSDKNAVADSGKFTVGEFGNSGYASELSIAFAHVYDSASPEYYMLADDSTEIVTALANVSKVNFSQSYDAEATGSLTVPANKTLDFTKGGDLLNYTGTITGNNTRIKNPNNIPIISKDAILAGTFIMEYPTPEMFEADGTDDVSDQEAMEQFMKFSLLCKHKEMQLSPNSRYRVDTTIKTVVTNDVVINGNNSVLYTSYEDVDYFDSEGQKILRFDQTYTTNKSPAGKGLWSDTLIVNNVNDIDVGMGVYIEGELIWNETHSMNFMSIVKEIIGTDTVILSDLSPFTLVADTISFITFYEIDKLSLKNIRFEYTDTDVDTLSTWTEIIGVDTTIYTRPQTTAIELRALFYPVLENIEIRNTNRTLISMSMCYRGNYSDIKTPVYYDNSIYGISAGSQYFSTFRDLHLRTNTPPIAFGNHPSVGCKVYDSDLSSVTHGHNGNIGFDTHTSHSVDVYNSTIKGINVSRGYYKFNGCTIYSTEYGGWAFSNRDRSKVDSEVNFTNCKFILEDYPTKSTYLFMPYTNTIYWDTLGSYNFHKCIIENNANDAYILHGDFYSHVVRNAANDADSIYYTGRIEKAKPFTIDNCVFKGKEISFMDIYAEGTYADDSIINQRSSLFFTNNKYDSLVFDRLPYEWFKEIYIEGNKPNDSLSSWTIAFAKHNGNLTFNNNVINIGTVQLEASNIKPALFFTNNKILSRSTQSILFEEDTTAYVYSNIHHSTRTSGGAFTYTNSDYSAFNNMVLLDGSNISNNFNSNHSDIDIIQDSTLFGYKIGGYSVFKLSGSLGIASNLLMGVSAGNQTMTGINNYLLGQAAGMSLTSGNDNVFSGYWSGRSTTSGNGNIGIGKIALYGNLTHNYSVGIGYYSLRYGNGGNYRTAVGAYTLYNSAGEFNTAIGAIAGKELTTGIRNLFLGTYAGCNQTTTSYQIILDVIDRTSAALELTNAPIVINANATLASQTIDLNAGDVGINGDVTFGGNVTYDSTFWDDLRVPVTNTKLTPSKAEPAYESINSTGAYAYFFDAAANDDEGLHFAAQIPHAYKHGTDLDPHIHWLSETTNGGDVMWEFEYIISTIGAVIGSVQKDTITVTANGTAFYHHISDFTDIDGTSLEGSDMIIGVIRRLGDEAGDTFTDDAILIEIDFHFEIDKPGSENEYP